MSDVAIANDYVILFRFIRDISAAAATAAPISEAVTIRMTHDTVMVKFEGFIREW